MKVAILLDVGCDISHPDLKEKIKIMRNFTINERGIKYLVADIVVPIILIAEFYMLIQMLIYF